ncbi:MAG TPA: 6-phosphogluconolactonase [Rhizobiaceae bacterium]|nr:6-phosphogluconolactonase [Rhizobiaceae bacterium]
MAASNLQWHRFGSGEALAETLAESVAQLLTAAIAARGRAILAVSGGTTPVRFFGSLSRIPIEWERVQVILVDERFVPLSSERSNARLVTHHLLQNEAARAFFTGLYHESDTVEDAAERADAMMAGLPLPIDIAILGMGTDAHTASFFPDAHNIEELLSKDNEATVLAVHADSAGEPRLTLSMRLLTQARFVALHIEGDEKKEALKAALADDTEPPSPIRALIESAETTVHVYWAPKQDFAS